MGTSPSKDELIRRAYLVAKAEEQAAIASEQATLARDATAQDLLSLSVAALALEQTAVASAGAYARWAELAPDEGRLLARSLEAVAGTLRLLAEQAQAVSSEADGYAASVQARAGSGRLIRGGRLRLLGPGRRRSSRVARSESPT
jgi:hypothetical protein